jgi:hypothetical protein
MMPATLGPYPAPGIAALASAVALAAAVGVLAVSELPAQQAAPTPAPTPAPIATAPPGVDWRASGGGIDRRGLFTAGSRAGDYQITVSSAGGAATGTVRVTVTAPPRVPVAAPPPPGAAVARADSVKAPGPVAATARTPSAGAPAPGHGQGIPFGYYGDWQDSRESGQTAFSLTVRMYKPEEVVSQINRAREQGRHLLLAMAGGAHRQYKTNGVFDLSKWIARMSDYNTTEIRDAIAKGVADGTVVGNIVMDEPHNTVAENSWGPKGTVTKAIVDTMCGYVKGMFPSLPVGVVHDHEVFQPKVSYHVCDFLLDQYAARKGPVTDFRDAGLAMGRRDDMSIIFSLNVIDGGTQARRDGSWDCPYPATGGRGTFEPNCRMNAQQILEFGSVLGPAACALTMWRYDRNFMNAPDNQAAFTELAARLAQARATSCARP